MNQVLDGTFAPASRQPVQRRPFLTRRDSSASPALNTAANAATTSAPSDSTTQNTVELVEGEVRRQLLSTEPDDNACPICQDTMTTEQALTWCHTGCGNNIHAKCMRTFIEYQETNHKPSNCPLCRADFDIKVVRDDMRKHLHDKEVPGSLKLNPISCSSCKCILRSGSFNRCIECSQSGCINTVTASTGTGTAAVSKGPVDFCHSCYTNTVNPVHKNHHFLRSDATTTLITVELHWTVVGNPIAAAVHASVAQSATQEAVLRAAAERELDMNDYDLLLSLDHVAGQALPSLARTCVMALPRHDRRNTPATTSTLVPMDRTQCWCCTDAPDPSGGLLNHVPTRVLPCGHLAHDKCLEEEVGLIILNGEAMSANSNSDISRYRCSHASCGTPIFPGLNRRKRLKRKDGEGDTVSTANTTSNTSSSNGSSGVASAASTNTSHSLLSSMGSSANSITAGSSGLSFGLIGSGLGIASSSVTNGNNSSSGPVSSVLTGAVRVSNNRGVLLRRLGAGANRGVASINDSFGPPVNASGGPGDMYLANSAASLTSRSVNNADSAVHRISTGQANTAGSGGSISSVRRGAGNDSIDPLTNRLHTTSRQLPTLTNTNAHNLFSDANNMLSVGNAHPSLFDDAHAVTSYAPSVNRNKRPPLRSNRIGRLKALSGNTDHSVTGNEHLDNSDAGELLTVNPITTPHSAVYSDHGSGRALSPPAPPAPQQQAGGGSHKNKVSALLSSRLRSTSANSNSASDALTTEVVNMTITNSGSSTNLSALAASGNSGGMRRQRSVPLLAAGASDNTHSNTYNTVSDAADSAQAETDVHALGSLLSVNSTSNNANTSTGTRFNEFRGSLASNTSAFQRLDFNSSTNTSSGAVAGTIGGGKRPRGRLARGTAGIATNTVIVGADNLEMNDSF